MVESWHGRVGEVNEGNNQGRRWSEWEGERRLEEREVSVVMV